MGVGQAFLDLLKIPPSGSDLSEADGCDDMFTKDFIPD